MSQELPEEVLLAIRSGPNREKVSALPDCGSFMWESHQHFAERIAFLAYASGRASIKEEAAKAGAEAYAELLRQIQNNIPHDVGTEQQAYDHVITRMQDKHGSYQAQIAKAVKLALRALP